MELTINTNSFEFSEFLNFHEKPIDRKSGLIMKRLRVKRKKKLSHFNKWFEKEHDYCLPSNNRSKKNDKTEEDNDIEEMTKSLESNSESLDNSKTTDLEKINVNNELSSCSLYAIDITTELLKDALLENKKKQLNYFQSTTETKDSINSNNCVSSIINQPCCNQNNSSSRLSNENILHASDSKKEKSCVSRESTPPKLFSPMDIDNNIDSDMIKLFPTLDFFTEHNLNEKLENIECKEVDSEKNILSVDPNKTTIEKNLLCETSLTNTISKSTQPLQIENCIKSKFEIDIVRHKPPSISQKLSVVDSSDIINSQLASEQYINIFNRYQGKSKEQFVEQVEDPGPILLKDLLCGSKSKTIISPYTHRHLKPYIFRDPVTKPLWLRMLNELKEYFIKKKGLIKSKEVETIDYSYVRAKHIQSVNALATQFFWPGIDLSESLLYPDFSVIALYKNLVIGFGFMVPDISTNENYITFLFTRPHWTNCGIATFMIYHLIQTCMTRDVTLHVSPNNPAMILYQKFGFKIEEFVQNFYENYISAESNLSKHALFLRLRSTFKSK